MKILLFGSKLFAAMGILSSLLFAQPKVSVVGGTTFDFGDVLTGALVKRVVTIKNIGTDTLNIDDVSTSCGCTATLLSKNSLAPKDSSLLEISFDSKKFSGKVEKAVTFETNDPEQKKVRIIFYATVNRLIECDPDNIVFNIISLDSVNVKELTVSNVGVSPITITSIRSAPDKLEFEPSKATIAPGEKVVIVCRFKPDGSGIKKGNVVMKTDNSKLPEISMRYFALAKESNSSSTNK